jgi:hypothetical protein
MDMTDFMGLISISWFIHSYIYQNCYPSGTLTDMTLFCNGNSNLWGHHLYDVQPTHPFACACEHDQRLWPPLQIQQPIQWMKSFSQAQDATPGKRWIFRVLDALIGISIHIYIYVPRVYWGVYIYVCVYVLSVSMCIYICIYIYINVYVYCIYNICIYVYLYVCMYIYIQLKKTGR